MSKALLFALLLGVSGPLVAQKKIITIEVSDTIVAAAVDRPGELYVLTRNGQIQKFGVDGKLLAVYKQDPSPTLFDPRDGARLFAYYRNDQHYSLLGPSLEISASFQIDSSIAISPWLISTSGDMGLWVLDAADNSLKKYNTVNSLIMADVRIPGDVLGNVADVMSIREYQGFLFLLDRTKGIHVFNAIGKWLRTVGTPGIDYFNFLGEELYYPAGNDLTFFNLFTASENRVTKPVPGQIILLTDERTFAVSDRQIDFYSALKR